MIENAREAIVLNKEATVAEVQAYMPSNYEAFELGHLIYITGHDYAGWTLDGYVIPRLSSGLIAARELV